MTIDLVETVLFAALRASTPLLLAALGVLILEKSGVLNLGQEGIISVSAIIAFITAFKTGSLSLALLMAGLSGLMLSGLFAFLVLVCHAGQVVSGLALSIFGVGLAAFIGSPFVGETIAALPPLSIDGLSSVPVIGRILFSQDLMVYGTWLLGPLVAWFLYRTRFGMLLRSVGENPQAAHALGYSPVKVRFFALLLSGLLVAFGGAYLSLAFTPTLTEGISAGRGWVAIALVVFASHRVGRLYVGALLFGLASIMHLVLQGVGLGVSGSILAMLPYLVTIIALVLFSFKARDQQFGAPKSLGVNFIASK